MGNGKPDGAPLFAACGEAKPRGIFRMQNGLFRLLVVVAVGCATPTDDEGPLASTANALGAGEDDNEEERSTTAGTGTPSGLLGVDVPIAGGEYYDPAGTMLLTGVEMRTQTAEEHAAEVARDQAHDAEVSSEGYVYAVLSEAPEAVVIRGSLLGEPETAPGAGPSSALEYVTITVDEVLRGIAPTTVRIKHPVDGDRGGCRGFRPRPGISYLLFVTRDPTREFWELVHVNHQPAWAIAEHEYVSFHGGQSLLISDVRRLM